MTTIELPWLAWLGDSHLSLEVPSSWEMTRCLMNDGPALDDRALATRIRAGLAAPEIRHRISGQHTAAIAVDDITRPTPTHRLLPPILDELAAAGIARECVRVVFASGCHRPASRADMVMKIGETLANELETYVHNPYEGLTHLGMTPRGIPVYTNRFFHEADVKLAVGCALPHEAGFSGGAKLIAIGLSGITTVEALHYGDWDRTGSGIGKTEDNPLLSEFWEVAGVVGLDALINVIVNSERDVAGLCVGQPQSAHREAVAMARQVYATPAPRAADVVILNAYPKDSDLIQATMALNVAYTFQPAIVKAGGTIVVTCACPEGAGIHFLDGFGMRKAARYDQEAFGDRHLIIFSPNLSEYDVQRMFPPGTILYRRWPEVVQELERLHGSRPRVSVFPWASQQLPFFTE